MIKKKIYILIIILLLLLASLRGLLVLYLNFPPRRTFDAVTLSLIVLCVFGLLSDHYIDNLRFLSKIFKLNLVFGIFYYIVATILYLMFKISDGGISTTSTLLAFIAPFSVGVFFKIPKKQLVIAFGIILCVISLSVIKDYYVLSQGKEGFNIVLEQQQKLRPDIETIGKIGIQFFSNGLTGSHHDSANIIGMLVIFFFSRSLINHSLFDGILAFISFITIHLTLSASNIVLTYLVCIFATIFIQKINRVNYKTIFYLFSIIVILILLLITYGELLLTFTLKFNPEGDRENMLNKLDMVSLIESIPFFIIGHASEFGNEFVKTEVALFKMVAGYGLISAALIFYILLYPIIQWIKLGKQLKALPGVMALTFGFLSLTHYGSLFRTTSFFLFWAIYSLTLKEIFSLNENFANKKGIVPFRSYDD